jgi:hypothetical protein
MSEETGIILPWGGGGGGVPSTGMLRRGDCLYRKGAGKIAFGTALSQFVLAILWGGLVYVDSQNYLTVYGTLTLCSSLSSKRPPPFNLESPRFVKPMLDRKVRKDEKYFPVCGTVRTGYQYRYFETGVTASIGIGRGRARLHSARH